MSEAPPYKLSVYTNRYDKDYQALLGDLLSRERLIEQAEPVKPGTRLDGKCDRRVCIHFCGLSALSILGGTETLYKPHNEVVQRFLGLVRNEDDIITDLNQAGIAVDIRFIFAYPYSDFMYDLAQAEKMDHQGFSMECVLGDRSVKPEPAEPRPLTYQQLQSTSSYQHLQSSLRSLQVAVNDNRKRFNHTLSPNTALVKFTPLSMLTCFLRINQHVFFDPYLYTKQQKGGGMLSLQAPISCIWLPSLPSLAEQKKLPETDPFKAVAKSYASLVAHFRFLWNHPLTLFSTDATYYRKNEDGTLAEIKEPADISYLAKAKKLFKPKDDVDRRNVSDRWMQSCKDELLRYCSKFVKSKQRAMGDVPGLPIFIVGAWHHPERGKAMPSEYMERIREQIRKHFGPTVNSGLQLAPGFVDANDGDNITSVVFKQLNAARIGIIILTKDETEPLGRPNIFYERGYLTARLGKRNDRASSSDKDQVFIFRQEHTLEARETEEIAITEFTDVEDFRLQFFRFVKWLWDITELNSAYAVEVIKGFIPELEEKAAVNPDKYKRLEKLAKEFIEQINFWESEYDKRAKAIEDE